MTDSNQAHNLDLSVTIAFVVMVAVLAVLLLTGLSGRTVLEVAVVPTDTPAPTPTRTPVPQIGYSSQDVAQGRAAFTGTCAGCHGQGAVGVAGLGPALINTTFVNSMTDTALREFIIVGRPFDHPENVSGITMPARGGNPSLSDTAIDQIIAYLRTEADPSKLIVTEQTAPSVTNTPRPQTDFVLNPTVVPFVELPPLEPRPFDVERAYALSCSGCHGPNGEGIAQITGPLWESELLDRARTDDLFSFIVHGNPYVSYLEGVPHPARGDYPSLTDTQIVDLIKYLHTLNN